MANAKIVKINDNEAILACIGEAESQKYIGLYAVSCAIRNRGTLKGVYGLNSKRVKNKLYSKETYELASKAWRESEKGQDITGGASFWEAVETFKEPYWAKSMIKTVKIGSHTFYKPKK